MEDDLQVDWDKLKISDDEEEEILFMQNWVKEVVEASDHCLLGRLLIKKLLNLEVMKNVLSRAWKLTEELFVTEVGDHIYIYQELVKFRLVSLLGQGSGFAPWSNDGEDWNCDR